MSNIFIKPASIEIEGEHVVALVRDPETGKPLDPHGEWKAKSQFWNRRLRDGDVIEVSASIEPAPAFEPAWRFGPCEACVTPEACEKAARCVKAPIA